MQENSILRNGINGMKIYYFKISYQIKMEGCLNYDTSLLNILLTKSNLMNYSYYE